MLRRTRIVATLGPASDRPGILERLIDAGLDVARINFSHGAADEHRRRIGELRQLAQAKGRPVAVLADLPGPKLRAIVAGPLELQAGQPVAIAIKAGVSADMQITEPEALVRAKAGQRVLLDDGRLQATVTTVTQERVVITMRAPGTLLPNKGVNFPDTDLQVPAVTRRDREAIAVACDAGADWLALSFVRDALS